MKVFISVFPISVYNGKLKVCLDLNNNHEPFTAVLNQNKILQENCQAIYSNLGLEPLYSTQIGAFDIPECLPNLENGYSICYIAIDKYSNINSIPNSTIFEKDFLKRCKSNFGKPLKHGLKLLKRKSLNSMLDTSKTLSKLLPSKWTARELLEFHQALRQEEIDAPNWHRMLKKMVNNGEIQEAQGKTKNKTYSFKE